MEIDVVDLGLYMKGGLVAWVEENSIEELEVYFPDINGVLRGKILPANKFISENLHMPQSAIAQSFTGDWSDEIESFIDGTDLDMELVPSSGSYYVVPWTSGEENVGQVICDCTFKGKMIRYAPRTILQRVLRQYRKLGLTPIVAPEVEFYLAKHDTNPDNPILPPPGRTGRLEFSRQPFNIDALNEFEPVMNDIYSYAEAQELAIDTLTHEEGVAQFEINFTHGEALKMADQVLLFKRCVREAARKHSVTATFMAKPIEEQPGSSMHIHMSVLDREGNNIFGNARSSNLMSEQFTYFIGGLQHYYDQYGVLCWPTINSLKRAHMEFSTVNSYWGVNNRTVGFRVPSVSNAASMRVESRLCGADTNPYLALAVHLLAGLEGMKKKISPKPICTSLSWEDNYDCTPDAFSVVLDDFYNSKWMREQFGNRFVNVFNFVKEAELDNFERTVTAWERKHLLHAV